MVTGVRQRPGRPLTEKLFTDGHTDADERRPAGTVAYRSEPGAIRLMLQHY